MRDDFAKQLTERERIGHLDHYHNYRHQKQFKFASDGEYPMGGREPMKERYRIGYSGKTFNENLNPLYGWLRTCVGKKWDKCYSELRQKFDMRKVVNDHILQHLYSDLEVNAYLNDKGEVVVLNPYRYRRDETNEVPISKSGSTYYVCPKDGVVKLSKKPLKRSVIKQREAEKRRAAEAVKRVIDKHNVLHLIDGVWYHFERKPVPQVEVSYFPPYGVKQFDVTSLSRHLYVAGAERKTWDELNNEERMRFGKCTLSGTPVVDLLNGKRLYRDQLGNYYEGDRWYAPGHRLYGFDGLYHAVKKTASKKMLKLAGLT